MDGEAGWWTTSGNIGLPPLARVMGVGREQQHDILKIINKMDNKSSSGYDELSNKIIKTIKNVISKPLTLIINQMITSGIFPDDLKIAKIIPLYKKGDSITNYRPISLLPTLSKIFEHVIFIQ